MGHQTNKQTEMQIEAMLQHLTANIEQYQNAIRKQYRLWTLESDEVPPLLMQRNDIPDFGMALDSYKYDEIQYDDAKMLHSGLKTAIMCTGESVPSVRANKGCGVYPTILGVKSTYFPDKMPWVLEHLSKDRISAMDPENIELSDEFKKGLETMAYLAKRLQGTGCLVYPLDLQGAVDTAHLVYGDAFFYDLYDDPAFIHHLMACSTKALIKGCDAVLDVLRQTGNTSLAELTFVPHYSNLIMPMSKGGIKFSEDTTTLLNPEQIDTFCLPYLRELLAYHGGGYVHYCGKNNHLYRQVMALPDVYGLNFGNPEMHDMQAVLKHCADTDKVYYGDPGRSIVGDSLEDYFYRCLLPAYNGRSFKLLLTYVCHSHETQKAREAWEAAVKKVIGS